MGKVRIKKKKKWKQTGKVSKQIIHIHVYIALKSTSESRVHYLLIYLLRPWSLDGQPDS